MAPTSCRLIICIQQTWIQDLLIQDQDQDFDVQDQDQDSRLIRPILKVHDWDGLWTAISIRAMSTEYLII